MARRRRTIWWWGLGVLAGLTLLGAAGARGQAQWLGVTAPDVTGGPWINSAPLTMEALRGRVVVVEFWTYG